MKKVIWIVLGIILLILIVVCGFIYFNKRIAYKNNLQTFVRSSERFRSIYRDTDSSRSVSNDYEQKEIISKIAKMSVSLDDDSEKISNDWLKSAKIIDQATPAFNFSVTLKELTDGTKSSENYENTQKSLQDLTISEDKIKGKLETYKVFFIK